MFGTVEAEIAAENQHKTNVIDERNLEKYHDQLSSFNTQATLVLGFAVASLNADNLFALGDDQSKYCLYKSERMAWGYVFGLSTCLSISTSLTCIAASFYLIVRSQHFALNVGPPPLEPGQPAALRALAATPFTQASILLCVQAATLCAPGGRAAGPGDGAHAPLAHHLDVRLRSALLLPLRHRDGE